MFTEEQIKLADLFIKHISTIDYKTNPNYFNYFKENHNVDFQKLIEIRSLLVKYDFLHHIDKGNIMVALTPRGYKAAKIGLEEYFVEIESEKEAKNKDDILSKQSILSGERKSRKISVIAIICSVIIPFLVVILDKNINPPKQESNYNRSDRKEIVDSVVSQLLTDSVFIEKTKDFIKHDTVFLNELKEKITK